MKRRSFIKNTVVAGSALSVPQIAWSAPKQTNAATKKLVVVQLDGGNDGLNTIVPYQSDIYYKSRPHLAIPAQSVLKLSDELGMHPALKNTASLFKEGQMKILNQVGYPQPNKSHFRATDIWHTASHAHEYLSYGWLGAFLDATQQQPHAAIDTNMQLSLALKGKKNLGMAFTNPKELSWLSNTAFFRQLEHAQMPKHENLRTLYHVFAKTKASAQYLKLRFNASQNQAEYPNSEFAKALKTIARFIGSETETSIFYSSLGSFDTHGNQAPRHRKLLAELDASLAAFVKDLKASRQWNNTLVLVFSEFGRRITENGSQGTDHGIANNVWLLGGNLEEPGFGNPATDLSHSYNNDLLHKMDFREIYASVLKNWFGCKQQILNAEFNTFKI